MQSASIRESVIKILSTKWSYAVLNLTNPADAQETHDVFLYKIFTKIWYILTMHLSIAIKHTLV